MNLESKICSDCLYETNNKKSFSNHRRYGCNAGRDYSREFYLRNIDLVRARTKKRYAENKCEILKLRREKYALNPEREKATAKKYSQTEAGKFVAKAKYHRYRAAKNGDVTSEQIKELVLGNTKCFVCGNSSFLEIDHIIPLSRGGKHTIENLQILCRKCNRSKGAKIDGIN